MQWTGTLTLLRFDDQHTMNSRDEDIAKAIRLRDVASRVAMFFEKESPVIKQGFKTETELWDYKSDVPFAGVKLLL